MTLRQSIPKYKKSPILEALYEVYFEESNQDGTIPGLFYERIKDRFPVKQKKEIQEARFALGPGKAMAGIQSMPPWTQFLSEDKQQMVQIARDLLVVNKLYPYSRFERWKPIVLEALKIYNELAKPEKVVRLGLRYINRIEIPEKTFQMEDYFKIYPSLPESLGNKHSGFVIRVEVPLEQEHTMLITFGTAPSSQEKIAFMLDFYDLFYPKDPFENINFDEKMEQAHKNIVAAFEDSITDKLRTIFEPEEQQ